jgi:hypothetical protein
MRNLQSFLHSSALVSALSFFILFMGCGRILSLTLHDPLLAYANNYEMIPLQACQQIWPADGNIDITRGTVAAPLRNYTLGKHVDTTCIFSSELLFTQLGIDLAKIMPGNKGIISLQTIGLVKALFLILTAIIAQIIFFRSDHTAAMLAHALVVLLVLSDPGITLYLSTFYTEFSAVYFLYLTVLGVSLLFIRQPFIQQQLVQQQAQKQNSSSRWHWLGSTLVITCGLIGFGLSKALHAPMLIGMSSLLALYLLACKPRLLCIPILMAMAIPLVLQNTNTITLANNNMILANKINTVATILDTTQKSRLVLDKLGLPDSCLALAGKNWYAPIIQKNKTCFELNNTSQMHLALFLLENPGILSDMVWAGLPHTKEWILFRYGQVESEKQGEITGYYGSLDSLAQKIGDSFLLTLLLLPMGLTTVSLLTILFVKKTLSISFSGLWLLSLLPVGVYLESLIASGLVDLPRHTHLVLPLLLEEYVIFIVAIVAYITKKIPVRPKN